MNQEQLDAWAKELDFMMDSELTNETKYVMLCLREGRLPISSYGTALQEVRRALDDSATLPVIAMELLAELEFLLRAAAEAVGLAPAALFKAILTLRLDAEHDATAAISGQELFEQRWQQMDDGHLPDRYSKETDEESN